MIIKQKRRDEIPDRYKWRLCDIYASDELWRVDYEYVLARSEDLAEYRGQLDVKLSECLALFNELSQKAAHVVGYAHMNHHADMAEPGYLSLKEQSVSCFIKLGAAAAFIEPEILAMDESRLLKFISAEPVYGHYIRGLLRGKAHVRSAEVEEVLANAAEISSASSDIFDMLENTDMSFGTVRDGEGREVELTQGRFISLMESPSRDVRKNVFTTYYSVFKGHINTLAAAYYGSVKADIFFARMRNYPSTLEASLFGNDIPRAVCDSLISEVNKSLPHMRRYMELRRKRFGVDELHMYDLYVPMVKEADDAVSYEEAQATVLKALAPLGEEYASLCRKAFENGWIDVYENANKHGGAYSWDDVYGVHPFVLLNFDNKLSDMYTLAHELGHALHTAYTDAAQPYIYSRYSTFVAEVASTVNEALLTDYLLNTVTDKNRRAYIVNHYLEQFRTTLFRQTMFAEFEMTAHSMAERGEPLTASSLCGLYRELNIKYYGGVTADAEIDVEWARIPHFYNSFYVYQYATGMSAALALSRKILAGGQRQYVGFLKSGASDYPINVLREAGVDMATAEPVKSAMEIFAQLVSEMEGLL